MISAELEAKIRNLSLFLSKPRKVPHLGENVLLCENLASTSGQLCDAARSPWEGRYEHHHQVSGAPSCAGLIAFTGSEPRQNIGRKTGRLGLLR
jgi:hypothetical protein